MRLICSPGPRRKILMHVKVIADTLPADASWAAAYPLPSATGEEIRLMSDDIATMLRDRLAQARRRYETRRPRSRAANQEAGRFMPRGNTRTVLYHEPFPICFARGEGAAQVLRHRLDDDRALHARGGGQRRQGSRRRNILARAPRPARPDVKGGVGAPLDGKGLQCPGFWRRIALYPFVWAAWSARK